MLPPLTHWVIPVASPEDLLEAFWRRRHARPPWSRCLDLSYKNLYHRRRVNDAGQAAHLARQRPA
jgi:hypothetical protein